MKMKTIIMMLLFISTIIAQDTIDKTIIDVGRNDKYIRLYDKMTHIVCYVFDGDLMQCFDLNADRVGPFKTKKEIKSVKQNQIDISEGYDE